MAEAQSLVPSFNVANSAYKIRVGRPKKYKDPWSTMNKRGYILGMMLEKLRRAYLGTYEKLTLALMLLSVSLFMSP